MKNLGSLFYNAAIMDFGTSTVKADFAGEEIPSVQFSSLIGKPKYTKVFSNNIEADVIGPDASTRGLYKLYHSIKRGVFINSEDASRIIQKVFHDLHVTDTSLIPVLVTQPVILPKNNKKVLAEIFFENQNTQYLFFGTQSVLSLFAHGKSDGIVLESGEGVTQVASVFNGYKIENAFEQISFGGSDVSMYLKFLFKRNGVLVNSSSEDCIFGDMKKHACLVNRTGILSVDSSKSEQLQTSPEINYSLPDGSQIKLKNERFLAGEVLFNPDVAGLAFCGIHELVENSIQNIDIDLARYLCKNVYLSGGNTQMNGFVERFAFELNRISKNKSEKNIIASKGDRSLLAWRGGSVITNMSSFSPLWISKQEYQENGERIFLTKFF